MFATFPLVFVILSQMSLCSFEIPRQRGYNERHDDIQDNQNHIRGFLEYTSIPSTVAEPASPDEQYSDRMNLVEPASPDTSFSSSERSVGITKDTFERSEVSADQTTLSQKPDPDHSVPSKEQKSDDIRPDAPSRTRRTLEFLFYSILYCAIQALLSYMLNKFVPNWHNRIYDVMTCLPRPVRWLVGPIIILLFFSFLTCLVPRLSLVLRGADPIGQSRSEELEHLRCENSRLYRVVSRVPVNEICV